MKALRIVGGGLAGLGLARALARRNVPVTVYEKDTYPRHKVCGEFITGLDAATRSVLDLDPLLQGALEHRRTAWFLRDRLLFSRELPQPALGISRWKLDADLAKAAHEAGATVEDGAGPGALPDEATEGWIDARGVTREGVDASRRRQWIGLKLHVRGMATREDLELHLGRGAYAGASAVEDGVVNVCMLLRGDAAPPPTLRSMEAALDAVGLRDLAARVRAAEVVPGSRKATAGLLLYRGRSEAGFLVLGDGSGMIAPFTGHGMALAFHSAACALAPLCAYAHGEQSWEAARLAAARRIRGAHASRVRWSRRLHPFLLHPSLQRLAASCACSPIFPWHLLYRLTHPSFS